MKPRPERPSFSETANKLLEDLEMPPRAQQQTKTNGAEAIATAFTRFHRGKKDKDMAERANMSLGQFSKFKNHGAAEVTPAFVRFCEVVGIDADAAIQNKFVPLADDADALELVQRAKRLAVTGKARAANKILEVLENEG